MVRAAPKEYGAKGLSLVATPQSQPGGNGPTPLVDASVSIMVFAPVSRKMEVNVEVTSSLKCTVLPDRFVSFDESHVSGRGARSWCLQFGSSDEAQTFARCVALLQEVRLAQQSTNNNGNGGGRRNMATHDLIVGGPDSPAVRIGDQVKAKYSVYAFDPVSDPLAFQRTILFTTKDAKKCIVGEGKMIAVPGVEEALIGMRKKGMRMVVMQPHVARTVTQNAEWGPHVSKESGLIIDVSISGVRPSVPVTQEGEVEGAEATQANPTGDEADADNQRKDDTSKPDEDLEPTPEGVRNPSTSSPEMDLRSRMAALASAQNTVAAVAASVPSTDSRRRLSHVPRSRSASPSRRTHGSHSSSSSTSAAASTPIGAMLTDLGLPELLPSFEREGVTMSDLLLLEADEIKQLVSQLGPRKRIEARIAEIKQQRKGAENDSNVSARSAAAGHNERDAALANQVSPPSQSQRGYASQRHRSSLHDQQHPSTSDHSEPPASPSVASVASRFGGLTTSAANFSLRSSRPGSDFMEPAPAPTSPVSFLSQPSSHPHSSTSSSSSFARSSAGLPPSHSELQALLSAEYARGQAETASMARVKIQEMKDAASNKFRELQEEIVQANERNEMDREKARDMVRALREEMAQLRAALNCAESNASKQARMCAQLKERLAVAEQERDEERNKNTSKTSGSSSMDTMQLVKNVCQSIYKSMQAQLMADSSSVYEGEEVMTTMKTVIQNVVKQATAETR